MNEESNAVLKKILSSILGIIVIVVVVLLYNLISYSTSGDPRIPDVSGEWWAGYYETSQAGKQWCVARFKGDWRSEFKMALISAGGPDVFSVEQKSNDRTFVDYKITNDKGVTIIAKQLYSGKKYMLQRLLAGRFKDFWKVNDDITLRGKIVSAPPPNKFEIAPIDESKLLIFWTKYIRQGVPIPLPREMFSSIGFE
jgi:hypothetical protein